MTITNQQEDDSFCDTACTLYIGNSVGGKVRVTACALSSSDCPYNDIDKETGSEFLKTMHGSGSEGLDYEAATKNAVAGHEALAESYEHIGKVSVVQGHILNL